MQVKKTKASFCNIPAIEKEKFIYSKCYILVSIDNKRQMGEKFEATINLINDKFFSCTVMVCDTLQRYNFMLKGVGNEDSYKLSVMSGDSWLSENKKYFIGNSKFNYTRWDEWLSHDDFDKYLLLMKNEFISNDSFKRKVEATVEQFSARNNHKMTTLKFSIDYILEECAVMLIWADLGFNYEIYPGGRNLAMTAIYEKFIISTNDSIMKSVSLRFKKNKAVSLHECSI